MYSCQVFQMATARRQLADALASLTVHALWTPNYCRINLATDKRNSNHYTCYSCFDVILFSRNVF
jgi:hypothetical protein